MTDTTKTSNLWQRIAWVQENLTTAIKSGRNKFQGYNYMKEEDILAALKPLLTKAGLATSFSVISDEVHQNFTTEGQKNKNVHLSRVRVKFTVVNIDKPEEFTEILGVGDGMDGGDKHVYAALTGANKYILMKTFLLPTGDDPEAGDDQRNKGSQSNQSQLAPIGDLAERADGLTKATFREWDTWWTDSKHNYETEGAKKVTERLELKRKILNTPEGA